jgi:hypothetical protein
MCLLILQMLSKFSLQFYVAVSLSFRYICRGLSWAMPWLRRLVAGLSPWRPGFDLGSVHVGFVVDKVALGHVFPRVLRFSPVSFIPLVLHYTEKRKKLIIFVTELHKTPQGCGASGASAAGLIVL